MDCREIWFSRHAIERMFERGIPPDWIRSAMESAEIIAEYPGDRPYPSYLLLGYREGHPVHVVASKDAESGRCHVITVYEPAPELWGDNFKTRRHQ